MFEMLLLSLAQLFFGFCIVGVCVLFWTIAHSWFADNRLQTNTISRSTQSWNSEHEFFDTIEEFRSDFS